MVSDLCALLSEKHNALARLYVFPEDLSLDDVDNKMKEKSSLGKEPGVRTPLFRALGMNDSNDPQPENTVLIVLDGAVWRSAKNVPTMGSIAQDHARLWRAGPGTGYYEQENIFQELKPPSEGAKAREMHGHQTSSNGGALLTGRPAALRGPPISVYHPIFAEFRKLQDSDTELTKEDYKRANELLQSNCNYYATKEERQYAIGTEIQHFLQCMAVEDTLGARSKEFRIDLHRRVPVGKWRAFDGSDPYICSFIGEVENGLGEGGCDRTAWCYLLLSANPKARKARNVCHLPAFLLTISGSSLSISGAIFLDTVVTEPLMDVLSMIPKHGVDAYTRQVEELARTLRALGQCLDKLEEYYRKLTPRDISKSLGKMPHLQALTTSQGEIQLTYLSVIETPRRDRAVFKASARKEWDSTTVDVVVKFTDRYFKEAHGLLWDENLERCVVPELLYCEFEETTGTVCVVSKYIEEAKPGVKLSNEGAIALKKGMERLHAEGYVFGDLREDNILLDAQGWPHLIDFDWSGKEGERRYPFNLFLGIDWATGVEDHGIIRQEHDKEMLEKYLKQQGQSL